MYIRKHGQPYHSVDLRIKTLVQHDLDTLHEHETYVEPEDLLNNDEMWRTSDDDELPSSDDEVLPPPPPPPSLLSTPLLLLFSTVFLSIAIACVPTSFPPPLPLLDPSFLSDHLLVYGRNETPDADMWLWLCVGHSSVEH